MADHSLRVDGYDTLDQLRAGATETWLACSRDTGELRVLRRMRCLSPEALLDRVDELSVELQRVTHEHLLPADASWLSEGSLLMARGYGAGGTLASLLAVRGRLSPGEVVTTLAPVGEALAALHQEGIRHGAVNGANLVFTADGRPLLTDVAIGALVATARQAASREPSAPDVAMPRPGTVDAATGDAGETRSALGDAIAVDVRCYAALCLQALLGPVAPEEMSPAADSLGIPGEVVTALAAASRGEGGATAESIADLLFASWDPLPVRLAPVQAVGRSLGVSSVPDAAALPGRPFPSTADGGRVASNGDATSEQRSHDRAIGASPSLEPPDEGATADGRSARATPAVRGDAEAWAGRDPDDLVQQLRAAAREDLASARGGRSPARRSASRGRSSSTSSPTAHGAEERKPRGRHRAAVLCGSALTAGVAATAVAVFWGGGPTTSADARTAGPSGVDTAAAHPTGHSTAAAPTKSSRVTAAPTSASRPARVDEKSSAVDSAARPSAALSQVDWRQTLQRLYTIRSDAFADGAPTLLDRVYAPGSTDLLENRRLVGDLVAADARAENVRLAVRSATLVAATGNRVVVRSVDELASYRILRSDGTLLQRHGGRAAQTVDVILRRGPDGWRIEKTNPPAG